MLLAAWKLATALARCNTVVIKRRNSHGLRARIHEARAGSGFRPAVVNVVTGSARKRVRRLVEHPRVAK